jgi:hypothetical protein
MNRINPFWRVFPILYRVFKLSQYNHYILAVYSMGRITIYVYHKYYKRKPYELIAPIFLENRIFLLKN